MSSALATGEANYSGLFVMPGEYRKETREAAALRGAPRGKTGVRPKPLLPIVARNMFYRLDSRKIVSQTPTRS